MRGDNKRKGEEVDREEKKNKKTTKERWNMNRLKIVKVETLLEKYKK